MAIDSASLIEIRDLTHSDQMEIIECKMMNNVPSSKKWGQRLNLFFNVVSAFDRITGLWLSSSYDQYVPQAALPPPNSILHTQKVVAQPVIEIAIKPKENGCLAC